MFTRTASDINLVANLRANSSQVVWVSINMAHILAFMAAIKAAVALLLARGAHWVNVALDHGLVAALWEKLLHNLLASNPAVVGMARERQLVHAKQLQSDWDGAITTRLVALLLALVSSIGAGPLAFGHALHVLVVSALDVTKCLAIVAAIKRHIA